MSEYQTDENGKLINLTAVQLLELTVLTLRHDSGCDHRRFCRAVAQLIQAVRDECPAVKPRSEQ